MFPIFKLYRQVFIKTDIKWFSQNVCILETFCKKVASWWHPSPIPKISLLGSTLMQSFQVFGSVFWSFSTKYSVYFLVPLRLSIHIYNAFEDDVLLTFSTSNITLQCGYRSIFRFAHEYIKVTNFNNRKQYCILEYQNNMSVLSL